MSTVNIGLIGAGTVGCGVYKVLTENKALIEKRLGAEICLKKIADIDPNRERPVDIPKSMFTTDAMELIQDKSIDIIIELVGGATVAKDFILQSIKRAKHVVTANKALLAHHGREIFAAAAENGVDVGFEASVGGGIPIIKVLREAYVANNILSIHGILNGTTNYILSKMTDEGREFQDVLQQAQDEGYAEADPAFDIDGIDAAHKISILVMLSFGMFYDFDSIPVEGIRHITPVEIAFADEFGYKIKLLSVAKHTPKGIEISVHPALIKKGTPLADVSGAFNAIHIEGDAVGPTMLYGMGAGMLPTASAVLSDTIQIARNILHNNTHSSIRNSFVRTSEEEIKLVSPKELQSRFYIRFQLDDHPGLLGQITSILGKHNVSIESVIQKGKHTEGGDVPVVMMTHKVLESNMLDALSEIDTSALSKQKCVFIRIADIFQ